MNLIFLINQLLLAGRHYQSDHYWLHTLCLFCKNPSAFNFRTNGWSTSKGFKKNNQKSNALISCCHPLNNKQLNIQYSGFYPFIDIPDISTTGTAKSDDGLGGIEVDISKMFARKFNFSSKFSAGKPGYFHPIHKKWTGTIGDVSIKV
jgi:hypothetical protein